MQPSHTRDRYLIDALRFKNIISLSYTGIRNCKRKGDVILSFKLRKQTYISLEFSQIVLLDKPKV